MSLAYSLYNAKEVSNALEDVEDFINPPQTEPPKLIPTIPFNADPPQAQNFIPTKSAIQPYNPPQDEAMDFDLLAIINDIDENQMVLAASQMEQKLFTNITVKTNKETTTMIKASSNAQYPSPLANCRIGLIGTININIYKN